MTLELVLIAQGATLAALVVGVRAVLRNEEKIGSIVQEVLRQFREMLPPVAGPSVIVRDNGFHGDSGIWQALKIAPDGAYYVHEWVREGTIAWQRALDSPGVYLRRSMDGEQGSIVEGRQ